MSRKFYPYLRAFIYMIAFIDIVYYSWCLFGVIEMLITDDIETTLDILGFVIQTIMDIK